MQGNEYHSNLTLSLWSELNNAAQLKIPVSYLVFWFAPIRARCSSRQINATVQGHEYHSNLTLPLWAELNNAAQLKAPVSCLVFLFALIRTKCSLKLLNVTVQGNSCHSNLSPIQLKCSSLQLNCKSKSQTKTPLVKGNYHKTTGMNVSPPSLLCKKNIHLVTLCFTFFFFLLF